MNQELACNIGAGLEEIVRHHPEFVSTCLGELFLSLLVVAELGEQLLQNSFANSTFESNEFTEKYLSVFLRISIIFKSRLRNLNFKKTYDWRSSIRCSILFVFIKP
jgi:hypothetical protein